MRRTGLLIVVMGGLLAGGSETASASTTAPKVCLQPLGSFDSKLLQVSKRGIEYLYGLDVEILAPRALPKAAYYKPRRRYRAEKLLDELDANVVPSMSCALVVGFTSVDISTTKGKHKDWGIMGLAWVGGPSGVVSTFRLGRRVSARKKAMRTVKVMNHELGHALGVGHQSPPGCLMQDANGTVKSVDEESGLLCPSSREIIGRRHRFELPNQRTFEWARVLF